MCTALYDIRMKDAPGYRNYAHIKKETGFGKAEMGLPSRTCPATPSGIGPSV